MMIDGRTNSKFWFLRKLKKFELISYYVGLNFDGAGMPIFKLYK